MRDFQINHANRLKAEQITDYAVGNMIGQKMEKGLCSFSTVYYEARKHCDDSAMHLNVLQGWIREVVCVDLQIPENSEERDNLLMRLCDKIESAVRDEGDFQMAEQRIE